MPKAKKLPSGSWRVQVYVGNDGKKRKKSFTAKTKKEAEAIAAEWLVNHIVNPDVPSMTLGEAMDAVIETCRSQNYSPSTIPSYAKLRRNSYPSIINKPISDITFDDVQTAMDERAKDHAPKTVRNDYTFICQVLARYRQDLNLKGITLAKKKSPKKRHFNENWASSILKAAEDKRKIDPDFYLYTSLIINAGLRPSEIYSLNWEDLSAKPIIMINGKEKYKIGYITIDSAEVKDEYGNYTHKAPKTDAGERTIPVAWEFFEDFYKHKPRQSDSEKIFTMKPYKCSRYWAEIKQELGLPDWMRFYDLRHYFATAVAYSGASEEELSARMGHSTSTFTHQVYIELFEEHSRSIDAEMAKRTVNLFKSSHESSHDHEKSLINKG